jgi:hypothetical protein
LAAENMAAKKMMVENWAEKAKIDEPAWNRAILV